LYHAKGDKEKSAYYYEQALRVYTGKMEECYKLVTCAMEQADHKTAYDCLERILEERTYDVTMSFFHALSLANMGKYQESASAFSKIHRIYPNDKIVKYYAQYTLALAEERQEKNLFPVSYVKELPPSIVKAYKKKISELYSDPKKGITQAKRKDVQSILEWGLVQEDDEYSKNTVFILSNCNTKWAEQTLLNALMDIDVSAPTKRAIITVLVLSGYKDKLDIIANDFYTNFKPKKLVCENKIDGDVFIAAYAICLSRIAYWNVDIYDKIAFSINKIYKKLGGEAYIIGLTPEEIGAIAVCMTKEEKFTNPDFVCKYFDVREEIVKEYLGKIKGDKNGKNN
jgi:tetratricopeptide (TPR) repeat protein